MNKIIISIGVILIICVALNVYIFNYKLDNVTADVYRNGELIKSLDLSDDCEFVITGDYGENTVTVRHGQICISHADCRDQICVNQGWISNGVVPIVCLPNKIVIEIETDNSDADYDHIAR